MLMRIFVTQAVIISLVLAVTVFGQAPRPVAAKRGDAATRDIEQLLIEVTPGSNPDGLFSQEAKRIAGILSGSARKSPVFMDETGLNREFVLNAAAAHLAAAAPEKKIYKVNWGAVLSNSKSDRGLTKSVKALLAASPAGSKVLYVEDISAFSTDSQWPGPVISGLDPSCRRQREIAGRSGGPARRLSGARSQPTSDLKGRFQKVDSFGDPDPFVGDKLSPDLRELVAEGDPNRVVKVILQADDISNPSLLNVLRRNNVEIESRAENLDMIVANLPVRVAEQVASARGARHLSLDRETRVLGHIETTTGASLVRTVQQGLNLGLLGATVLNTSSYLDGTGIGIAVVDSSIREDHRSFVADNGSSRVITRRNFTQDSNVTQDEYGHGSHVASLAAGGDGANLSSADGTYLSNYRGIASNANVINVRVLEDNGAGSTASLINALDWLYTVRTQYNVRIVNLSLGAPAIETWRNDPLCRAARKLTAAGIVVVAAAGNNGKDANGQKIYGAIHSPGNDPSVITVGAANTFGTDRRDDDGVTTYSSRGPTRSHWTDNAGVKHYDHLIKPDLVAPGNLVIGARAKGNDIADENPELAVPSSADDSRKDDVPQWNIDGYADR